MGSEAPVTVLMTVRNGEPYVQEAVRSILEQTCGDFKFLILDNASTDRTRDIIHSFGDARIELLPLERDLKQVGALNRGLSLVESPYVARIDADDVSHPQRLQRQMAFVEEHPEIALLGTWYEAIDGENRIVARYSPPADRRQLATQLLLDNPFAHSSVLFDRRVALTCGGYNKKFTFAHDYALWLQIAHLHSVAILPEYLAQIRKHPGQWGASSAVTCQRAEEIMDVLFSSLEAMRTRGRLARRARGRAYLRYAVSLGDANRSLKSLRWLGCSLLQDPLLPASRLPAIGRLILRAALREKGVMALNRARRLFCRSTA